MFNHQERRGIQISRQQIKIGQKMARYQVRTAGKRNKGLGNGNGCIIKDPINTK